jgi:hypothetical protein
MFYLRYLRNELVRRRTRTIVTLVGLGLGVALVVAIASLSKGLDRAQRKTLDPLAGIGTDLTVTLAPQQQQSQGFGFGPGGGGNRDLIQSNLSVLTDLSKLGKPGAHFVHDFFLPGTQLTFPQRAAQQIASLDGVQKTTTGLTLLAEHQEGVVPKIVATLKTQAKTLTIQRNLPRPTAKDFAQMQACLQKAGVTLGRPQTQQGQGFGNGFGGGTGQRNDANRQAFQKCLPASMRRFRTRVTTPSQTLKQVLDPPQTNISTTAYTIGGVDQSSPNMGVVTAAQVTKGTFLSPAGGT